MLHHSPASAVGADTSESVFQTRVLLPGPGGGRKKCCNNTVVAANKLCSPKNISIFAKKGGKKYGSKTVCCNSVVSASGRSLLGSGTGTVSDTAVMSCNESHRKATTVSPILAVVFLATLNKILA